MSAVKFMCSDRVLGIITRHANAGDITHRVVRTGPSSIVILVGDDLVTIRPNLSQDLIDSMGGAMETFLRFSITQGEPPIFQVLSV